MDTMGNTDRSLSKRCGRTGIPKIKGGLPPFGRKPALKSIFIPIYLSRMTLWAEDDAFSFSIWRK